MELRTERLGLNHWSPEYFERYAEVFANPRIARYLGGTMDRAKAWRHMATLAGHWALRGYGPWAVVELATGKLVGSIGLWFPEGWPELELSYWLTPDAHGRGYATEAGVPARDYAFEALGAQTLVSYISPANAASKRVAQRLGASYQDTIDLADYGPHCVFRYPAPSPETTGGDQ